MSRVVEAEPRLLPQDEAINIYLDVLMSPVDWQKVAVPSADQLASGLQPDFPIDDSSAAWLSFQIQGLKLAIPTFHIKQVLACNEVVTSRIESDAKGVISQFDLEGRQIRLVDPAFLFLGQKDWCSRAAQQCRDIQSIIIIISNNKYLGLTCDSVGEKFEPDLSEVRWRTEKTSRRWVVGTSKHYGCALIDVDELYHLFMS